MISYDKTFHWYRLICAPGFGPVAIRYVHKIAQESGCQLADILALNRGDFESMFPGLGQGRLHAATFEALHQADEASLYQEFEFMQSLDIRLLPFEEPNYPRKLTQRLADSAPPLLFIKGNLRLLDAPSVAIIGSRTAAPDALAVTERMAGELANAGFNIVSGYAKGVDTEAHRAALHQGGTTTLILSFGILEFSSKPEMQELIHHQSTDMVIVSQFLPRDKWKAANAMRRNEVVCGLADAVAVVECGPERDANGKMSGTFAGALSALKLNIPLFVLAPDELSQLPSGNAQLIQKGGISVTPQNAIKIIQQHLDNGVAKPATLSEPSQLSLF